jgi:hypothetical protein
VEPFFFFFIFAAVVIVVLAVLGYQQAKKRRMALEAWAASRGLSFDPSNDSGMDDRYPAFNCLREGDNRYAYNVMRGQAGGHGVTAFDYHYETHSTDSKGERSTTNHHFSAVIVATGLPLKPLVIREEGFFDKVGAFLGFDDINFESTEFSREFYVKSPDRRWAFDVIHQRSRVLCEHQLDSIHSRVALLGGDSLVILWRWPITVAGLCPVGRISSRS